MLTRAKVTYNLKNSPYLVNVKYSNGDEAVFYFSSQLYKEKFIGRQTGNREAISNSLSKRFGIDVKADILADLKLYTTIEKRGFFIKYNGEFIEWLKDITLDGLQVTVNSLQEM